MIRDLDETIEALLTTEAPTGTELESADISFDVPDSTWRGALTGLTVNCYLYDVRENLELKTNETFVQRSPDNTRAVRRAPIVRIDCSYCITAWSTATSDAVLEEHRLLSQILLVLLRNPTIPSGVLQGSLTTQIPPYPTVIASPTDLNQHLDFWSSLNQPAKPALNYVVTLALILDEPPAELPRAVETVVTEVNHLDELPE